jgi:nucleoside-diphosphate-sugar epimerase
LLGKRIAFFPSGGKNFIGTTDVVNGIEKAIEHGKKGESYLLSDQNLSYLEFFNLTSKINRQKTRLIPIPILIIRTLQWISKYFLKHSKINPINLEIIQVKNFYSSTKAQKELHWNPQFFYQDLQKAIKSFKG